jgi:high-affinity nickel-transport protein
MTVGSTIALGFLLGMRHATDADHIAAVAAIVGRERLVRPAAWIGVWWGLGHTMTIALVGAAIVLFNWIIEPRLGLAMEFGVGLMLVLLGVRNLSALRRSKTTPHGSGEAATTHTHMHHIGGTALARLDRSVAEFVIHNIVRPVLIGVVHGLAGSAAIALLVMTTIRDPAWAIVYLLVFGAGTIAGMSMITVAIAAPFASFGERSARGHAFVRLATGVASVALGLFLAYKIAVIDGLFAAVPKWTPN